MTSVHRNNQEEIQYEGFNAISFVVSSPFATQITHASSDISAPAKASVSSVRER